MSFNFKDIATRVKGDIVKVADDAARTALTNMGKQQNIKQTGWADYQAKTNKWLAYAKDRVTNQTTSKTVVTTDTYTKVMQLLNSWFIKWPAIAIIFSLLLNYLWSLVQW